MNRQDFIIAASRLASDYHDLNQGKEEYLKNFEKLFDEYEVLGDVKPKQDTEGFYVVVPNNFFMNDTLESATNALIYKTKRQKKGHFLCKVISESEFVLNIKSR